MKIANIISSADFLMKRDGEKNITLFITAGKEQLNMNPLMPSIVMRENSEGVIYFDTLPNSFFYLIDYSWEGPSYKDVTKTAGGSKQKSRGIFGGKEKLKSTITNSLVNKGIAIGSITGKGGYLGREVSKEEEIDSNAAITILDINNGNKITFGFKCSISIDVELKKFNWSHMKNNEDENEAIIEKSNKIALLKEYKELLDAGVINEEEFEQKKKELL